MISRETVVAFMAEYAPITQAAISLAAGISDGDLSYWLRGRRELSPCVLERIEIGLAALANICHDGNPWPLNFRAAEMVPIIRRYVKKHEEYLLDKAFNARHGESTGSGA